MDSKMKSRLLLIAGGVLLALSLTADLVGIGGRAGGRRLDGARRERRKGMISRLSGSQERRVNGL